MQLVTHGHPCTTGLPTIDAFVSFKSYEGPENQHYYTEKLVLLDGLSSRYITPEVRHVRLRFPYGDAEAILSFLFLSFCCLVFSFLLFLFMIRSFVSLYNYGFINPLILLITLTLTLTHSRTRSHKLSGNICTLLIFFSIQALLIPSHRFPLHRLDDPILD